jgi:hypothetical protein
MAQTCARANGTFANVWEPLLPGLRFQKTRPANGGSMTIHSNFHTNLELVSEADHHALPGTQARQGVALGRMRFVLGFGLASAIVALAIVYLILT